MPPGGSDRFVDLDGFAGGQFPLQNPRISAPWRLCGASFSKGKTLRKAGLYRLGGCGDWKDEGIQYRGKCCT